MPPPNNSKTKQPTPPLPKRIHRQRTQKQPHRNPNRHLNHTIPHIQHHAIQIPSNQPRLSPVIHRRRPMRQRTIHRLISDLIRRSYSRDQTTRGS